MLPNLSRRDWRDELSRQVFDMLSYGCEQIAARHTPDQGPAPKHYRDEGWHRAVAIIAMSFTYHGRFKSSLLAPFPSPTGSRMPTPEEERETALAMLTELVRLLNEAAGPDWEAQFHSASYALHCAAGMVTNVIRECLCHHTFEERSYTTYGYREEYIICTKCGESRDGTEELDAQKEVA